MSQSAEVRWVYEPVPSLSGDNFDSLRGYIDALNCPVQKRDRHTQKTDRQKGRLDARYHKVPLHGPSSVPPTLFPKWSENAVMSGRR